MKTQRVQGKGKLTLPGGEARAEVMASITIDISKEGESEPRLLSGTLRVIQVFGPPSNPQRRFLLALDDGHQFTVQMNQPWLAQGLMVKVRPPKE